MTTETRGSTHSERLHHFSHNRFEKYGCHFLGARSTLLGMILGTAALAWLLIRSGTKPTRLAYPCQQSAFGLASAAFGAPFAAAVMAGGAAGRSRLRSIRGRIATVGLCLLMLVIVVRGFDETAVTSPRLDPPADYSPSIYLIKNAQVGGSTRFAGVDALVNLMGRHGLKWHRSALSTLTAGPDGLIDHDDVVLVKVNAQWAQRGGTNSDVLRGILRRVVEHPDGFAGEIVVADNGQGLGNLNRSENNAEDTSQSMQDVVNDFAVEGWRVSTKLWDSIRSTSVAEYSAGNSTDGYVVTAAQDPETSVRVSYPKFRTAFGTYLSYKRGVWDSTSQSYDAARLVVINIPVLKTHSIYGVTGAVKNHMGVITQALSTDSHNGVGRGGLGSVLADVRMPDLTILDCIWVMARPGLGPSATYVQASRRDQLVASRDPVALDMWAVRNILIPQIEANGYTVEQYAAQNPDEPDSTFRRYLDRSMNELLLAGIATTNDPTSFRLFATEGPSAIPAASTWGALSLSGLLLCAGSILARRIEAPAT